MNGYLKFVILGKGANAGTEIDAHMPELVFKGGITRAVQFPLRVIDAKKLWSN
jgi:hypothetical protein